MPPFPDPRSVSVGGGVDRRYGPTHRQSTCEGMLVTKCGRWANDAPCHRRARVHGRAELPCRLRCSHRLRVASLSGPWLARYGSGPAEAYDPSYKCKKAFIGGVGHHVFEGTCNTAHTICAAAYGSVGAAYIGSAPPLGLSSRTDFLGCFVAEDFKKHFSQFGEVLPTAPRRRTRVHSPLTNARALPLLCSAVLGG